MNFILEYANSNKSDAKNWLIAYKSILHQEAFDKNILEALTAYLSRVKNWKTEDDLSLKFGAHPEVIDAFVSSYNLTRSAELLESLCRPGPVTLRLPRKVKAKDILSQYQHWPEHKLLNPHCIAFPPGSYIKLSAKRDKGIEFQDFGSQAISYLLEGKPGEKILDLCAGRGGKSLHLADLTDDQAIIYATDFEAQRTRAILQRNRNQYRNIRVIPYNQVSSQQPYDRILIDAPCSGSGSYRRNPGSLLQPVKERLQELQKIQQQLLEYGFGMLKPGGQLVYATCSLLQIENEAQIERFLNVEPSAKIHPVESIFQNLPLMSLAPQGLYLKLSPVEHNTDGFFAAVLQKQC